MKKRKIVKKPFMAISVLMALFLLTAVFLHFSDNPVEFPFPENVVDVGYGIYTTVMVLFFILSFGDRFTFNTGVATALELASVYFVTESIVVSNSEVARMDLPIALMLNVVASCFNLTEVRKQKLKIKKEKEEKKRAAQQKLADESEYYQ